MRDLYRNILVTQHLNPVNSTSTKTSTSIDLQGYNSANILFAMGASGDTLSGSVYWTLKLTHSDDDADYSDVVLAELTNGAATVVVDSSAKDKTVYGFGYVGNKRYLRAVATPTGTHSTGTPIGMVALRGTASYRPVN
jgi:hypothetical protein